jgi:tripartite-type tricarboxylate transporter receptor subunit TctC
MHRIRIVLIVIALLAWPMASVGQGYPSKPIRIVVPTPPGGSQDVLARSTAQRLSELLGQPIIVDNRPGAGGIIAATVVAKSAPDGYTLLLAPLGHYTTQYFFRDLPFDPHKDFSPVINLALIPNAVVVQNALPVQSMRELLEYGKANPGRMQYGTYAIGSLNHLAGILITQLTGVAMEHIPYKGGAAAVADVLAGQIPIAIVGASSVLPQARSGKLRILAVIENRRFASVPGAPSIGETLGYALPDSWLGLIGPAGLPRAIVDQLNAQARSAIHTSEVKRRLENLGFEVTGNESAEQFAAAIRADTEMLGRLILAAGIKPE